MKEIPITKLAKIIRSKNAGPFEITFDLLFKDQESYQFVKRSKSITKELFAKLYHIPIEKITYFGEYEPANAIKVTIARTISSGTVGDTDVYGAQQYAPLLKIKIKVDE